MKKNTATYPNIFWKRLFLIFLSSYLFFLGFLFQVSAQISEITNDAIPKESISPMNIRYDYKISESNQSLPPPLAPSFYKIIEGINFDEDAANTGSYHIPPDPIGAAGIDHVVSVVNTSIEWFTKAGLNQNSESLADFFSPLSPQTSTFDPKVIYDQYEDRFLVVTLEVVEVTPNHNSGNISSIFLAVSDDSDPNGIWYFTKVDAKQAIGPGDYFADYPGFALDEEAVYVTANLFRHILRSYGGVRLWIIDKSPFYAGGAASVTVHDPSASASLPGDAFTLQPAHMFGAGPAGVGTFLVNSGWVSGATDFLSVIRVDDPLGSPTFTNQFISLGDVTSGFSLPNAPQLDTSADIETNDGRALHAVWRNNELWGTLTVDPPSGDNAGQATAHWYRIDTSVLSSLSLLDQGDIGGEDIATDAHTFFPAISIDKNGNMAIGFSSSAPSIYPGAYYTGRLATDPPGTVQPSTVFAAGLDYYYRQFGGTQNRWGDYSGLSVDPVDDETFWVFNEYALTHGTILPQYPIQNGRWGTRFANFTFATQSISPGDVIITEIMQNPNAVLDSDGEWFEIYNTTASPIDLNGWTIRDDDIDVHIIGGPLIISSHSFLVLGINDTSSINGNYTTNYRYSELLLANGADEVVLEDPDGIEIDRVNYDGGPNFPNPDGASMALINFQLDNNIGSNWIESTARELTFTASGDLGSPGTLGFDQSLPVTLTSFTATAGNNKVTLRWITESELNNVGFRILRSSDISGPYNVIDSFEQNPELEGQFNSNTPHEYFYIDDLVTNGITFWYKIVDVNIIGVETEQAPISATPQNGIGEITTIGSELPTAFELHPCFPNPFNPETNVVFDIPLADNTQLIRVDLTVYNTLGQKAKDLFQGQLSPGVHMVSWKGDLNSGREAAGGTYFAVLKIDRFQKVIKLILLR